MIVDKVAFDKMRLGILVESKKKNVMKKIVGFITTIFNEGIDSLKGLRFYL